MQYKIRKTATTVGALVFIGLILWSNQLTEKDVGNGAPLRDDAAAMVEAYEAQRGDLWVESYGTVDKTLKDDNEGSRHQRFIVRLSNDHTVLISHNIDLAHRVPVSVGDRVVFRGEFEWNHRGGVVHWTHHDPQGGPGGWIEHHGKRFQ